MMCILFVLLILGDTESNSMNNVSGIPAAQKTAAAKHKRVRHTRKPLFVFKPAPPVLDTTCLDTANILHQTLITEINKWSGTQYHHGGMSRKGIDCSGFTYRVFNNALELPLPRTSSQQALVGKKVESDDLQFGDLVFFYSKIKSKHKRIHHVGIYIGDDKFVHSRRHHGVDISSLSQSYYAKHFAWATRVIPSEMISLDNTSSEK
jgi:cell wall-associated NlpC family hydrolase